MQAKLLHHFPRLSFRRSIKKRLGGVRVHAKYDVIAHFGGDFKEFSAGIRSVITQAQKIEFQWHAALFRAHAKTAIFPLQRFFRVVHACNVWVRDVQKIARIDSGKHLRNVGKERVIVGRETHYVFTERFVSDKMLP